MPSPTSKAKFIARIIDYFSKGDRKRTPLETLPKVHIDSDLISWGLLSQPFGTQHEDGRGFWRTTHQIVIILFEWFMVFKWLFCIIMPENYVNPVFIGDFVAFLPGKPSYYYLPLTLWTSVGAVSATFFFISRAKSELIWLKPFEVCKGSLKPAEVKLEPEEAAHFWQRVIITLWTAKFMIRNMGLISLLVCTLIFGKLWPSDKLVPYGLVWALVSFIWVYYTICIQYGVMTVFHQVCYYLIVKFQKVNQIAKQLKSDENIDPKRCYQKIHSFMIIHNDITREAHRYNEFWQFNMVLNFVIYIVTICFIINLVLFGEMIFMIRMLLLASIVAFFVSFSITTFSAGAVANEAHDSYAILNSISQHKMPLVLKTQLQIYIQRLGGPTIGFTCWNLFTVTYDSFFHAILMIGSFFLLLMDVTQSELKSRNMLTTDPSIVETN